MKLFMKKAGDGTLDMTVYIKDFKLEVWLAIFILFLLCVSSLQMLSGVDDLHNVIKKET